MGKFFNTTNSEDNTKNITKQVHAQEKKEVKDIKKEKVTNEPISTTVILINLVLFGFIIFMGAKFYIAYNYKLEDDIVSLHNEIAFDLLYLNSEYELQIETENYSENDYLTFENIKIFNVFEGFTIENKSTDSISYVLYDDNENIETSLTISITENPISVLKSTYNDEKYTFFDLLFKNLSAENLANEYLSTNDINNEYELLKLLNEDFDTTFLTDIDTVKSNYALGYLISSLFSNGDKTLITGDYTGYIDEEIVYEDYVTTYVLIIENTNYIFEFCSSDYYTTNELNNIINSIIID